MGIRNTKEEPSPKNVRNSIGGITAVLLVKDLKKLKFSGDDIISQWCDPNNDISSATIVLPPHTKIETLQNDNNILHFELDMV